MSKPAAHSAWPKVVSLNARGGERSPGARIFSECRDLLLERLSQWLRDTAATVAEELFALADSTRDRVQQTRYLDLRASIESDWTALIDSFRREFGVAAERCQGRLSAPASGLDVPLELPDFEGLTLVDDADLSKHIVVREFAAMLSESCAEELYPLERRVAVLLGHDEANNESNPLAPPVLCQALSDACAAIITDVETRLLLLRRLQRHLHQTLPAIYQQVNARLIERGILPDLKRNYGRSAGGEQAAARAAPSRAEPSAAPDSGFAPGTQRAADGDPAWLSGEAILLALQRLAQSRSERLAMPSGVALTDAAAATAAAGGAGETSHEGWFDATTINQLLLSSLDELQHAPSSLPGEPIVNRVRQLRDSDNAQLAGGLEAVTIDIIAMLFDFIFDDAHIPVAIKALVSRLQIPVLKVAMLNPDFFADRQHPTRRFLGSISGISIRWGDSVDENDPFFRKLAELVERIQNEFESDVGIFGTALSELEAFVAQRQSEDEDTALTAVNAVNLREQQNAAWQRAQQAVDAFCQNHQPPQLIADFVHEHWLAVLQAAALNDDTQPSAWRNAEQAMNDLAWSVEAKRSADDRLKLITLLPVMLASLKRGLVSVNTGAEQCAAFFDALLPYHAAALKGEAVTPAAAPDRGQTAASETPSAIDSDGDFLVTRSVDDGIEVEEIMLVGASPSWRPDDQEIYRQVSELKRGDWVEFAAPDAVSDADDSALAPLAAAAPESAPAGAPGAAHRERLNWISPRRAILLFSNHRSAKAISISPEALARQIRDGRARIVRHDPLFERALCGALESASALGG